MRAARWRRRGCRCPPVASRSRPSGAPAATRRAPTRGSTPRGRSRPPSCQGSTRERGVGCSARPQAALIQRNGVNRQAGDDGPAIGLEGATRVAWSGTPPPSQGQMGMEGSPLERDAGLLQTPSDLPLHIRHLACSLADAEPQHARRTVRRKHAKTLERHGKWRDLEAPRDSVNNWGDGRGGGIAKEDERQMHLGRLDPLERRPVGMAELGRDVLLFGRDRGSDLIVQVNRSKQTHEPTLLGLSWGNTFITRAGPTPAPDSDLRGGPKPPPS